MIAKLTFAGYFSSMGYRIGSVRRKRQEGQPEVILTDLLDHDGNIFLSGPMDQVIARCEERRLEVSNLEQAKEALRKMMG